MICPSDKKFGGGQDNTTLNALLDGSISEIYNDEVTSICAYCFNNRINLKTIILPNATFVGSYAFEYLSELETLKIPNITSIGQYACRNTTKLKILDLAALSYINGTFCFRGSGLEVLILRTTNRCTLFSIDCFSSTAFRNGTGGTVYVDYSQKIWYPTANQWRLLESATFKSIQENLATLYGLGVNIDEYRLIVDELPTTDIDDTKTYWIMDSGTTYHQWFHGSGSWEQLADITI